jgi:1,2-diacylglycerol 3-alpha-glucosyltransferase
VKILMVSDVYFPRVNGVSTSIATFRRELEARGHEVHLIAPDYGKGTDDERRIHRIPSRRLPLDPEDRMMVSGHVHAMGDRLRAAGFDLVHIQTPFVAHRLGVRLSNELGVPRVETYHTLFEEYLYHYVPLAPKELMRLLARRLARSQCNDLDGLVVPSSAMLDRLRDYGVATHADIIPTGLEPESFEPGDGRGFRARYGIAPERPVLVYIGRVAHEKNIGFLLQVTARLRRDLPEVLLVVAGGGPALDRLRREAQALGIEGNVLFVGYLDRRKELPDCYRAGDVFVFASHTETQGLVLLEAMAQGVPLVALAKMGTRDVLRHGEGAWIAEDSVEDFAGRTAHLLADRTAASRLGAAGREYAARWAAGALAERMLGFYQAVCEGHRRGAAGRLSRSDCE